MNRLGLALALLQQDARPAELAGMARFGINIEQRLGLSMPAMRRAAKALGHDHALALALWDTGIPDARIVAGMVQSCGVGCWPHWPCTTDWPMMSAVRRRCP